MKELTNTKVTVRLRKAEDRKEWYVYIESYPVFVPGKQTPQRIREYLNRSVTTVEWDKKRTARTEADGTRTYKPSVTITELLCVEVKKIRKLCCMPMVFVSFDNVSTTMPIYTAIQKTLKPSKKNVCNRIL